jgi:hypothetical protein
MNPSRFGARVVSGVAFVALTLAVAGPVAARGRPARDAIRHWNQVAIDASGLDHTPIQPGEARTTFAEQLGPGRASRAMAIVHIAIFDAVNAIAGRYESYTGLPTPRPGTSMRVAVAQAAHDTLVAMFPAQAATFDEELEAELSRIGPGRPMKAGIDLGSRAAAAILALRADDGSHYDEPLLGIDFIPSDQPGA